MGRASPTGSGSGSIWIGAYWTMSPDYVESVWWILKQIWDKGLLEEDFKVVPYCPRCETALSSHEQHYVGSYQTVVDPSVFVRFPLVDEPDTSLARVDDDSLDAAGEHGGRRRARHRVRGGCRSRIPRARS